MYCVLFYLSLRMGLPAPADPVSPGITVLRWTVYNFTIVAFVEELFFRGYLQERLKEQARSYFSGPRSQFWSPVVVTAALFALAHAVVDMDPARLAVFFPGFLFGWLRAKTGGILAPVLSHGTANMLSMLLIRSVS
jgi:membrane protease YdiL (CAAX protease family)